MSTRRLETTLQRLVRRSPLRRVVEPERAVRFAEFAAVGALGAVVDITVTTSTLAVTHYLIANALGFLLAVSFNFGGNWWLTFDRPDGSVPWQYASYVGLHSSTFGLRAIVIVVLVEVGSVPAVAASIIGIAVAAVANFVGSEHIFDGADELWLDAIEAINQIAHLIYHSRLRRGLRSVGLYDPLYRAYQVLFALLYRDDTHTVSVGRYVAELHSEEAAEIVSIMHTLEKENDILHEFIAELEADDVVWDIGANLGVFSVLAAQDADDVVAFEPVPQTAARCEENFELSDVSGTVCAVALSDQNGSTELALERDELGSQTPSLVSDAGGCAIEVPQRRGDTYRDEVSPPTVLKIDVEGAELAVLNGLSKTLTDDRTRLVYVETHDGTVHDGDGEAVQELLAEHGYQVDRVKADGGQTYLRGVKHA